MSQSASVLARLDALVASRSILAHPFYRAWTAGTLTRGDLATYARLYYPHVAAFPQYLAAAAAGADDPAVRDEIESNRREELGEPLPHAELWLRFAEAVGASRQAVAGDDGAAAAPAVGTFRRLCAEGTARGLAALYAYESQQPEVARRKEEGLRLRYGVRDPRALAYFEVHTEADRRHRDGERRALGACLDAGADGEAVLAAAGEALDAYWGLLDAVCDAAGLSRAC